MSGIRISEKHGVNPSIVHEHCFVCGKEYGTGFIALHGRLPGDKEAPRDQHIFGDELCPECKDRIYFGDIVLIEARKIYSGGEEHMERSGRYIWLTRERFREAMTPETEFPPKGIAYIEWGALGKEE